MESNLSGPHENPLPSLPLVGIEILEFVQVYSAYTVP